METALGNIEGGSSDVSSLIINYIWDNLLISCLNAVGVHENNLREHEYHTRL
jgi:hypothetical protein